MRMDRYNDNEEVNESLKTRTNKNQELFGVLKLIP